MNAYTLTLLAVLALATALEWWLAGRQARSVRAHRDRVPEAFAARIGLAEHRKAADYTLARVGLSRITLACDALLLIEHIADNVAQEMHIDIRGQIRAQEHVKRIFRAFFLSKLAEITGHFHK
jgi:hypothetical protein